MVRRVACSKTRQRPPDGQRGLLGQYVLSWLWTARWRSGI
jgi:hypothetical protein